MSCYATYGCKIPDSILELRELAVKQIKKGILGTVPNFQIYGTGEQVDLSSVKKKNALRLHTLAFLTFAPLALGQISALWLCCTGAAIKCQCVDFPPTHSFCQTKHGMGDPRAICSQLNTKQQQDNARVQSSLLCGHWQISCFSSVRHPFSQSTVVLIYIR
jgi:hypothetical protein